MQRLDNLPDFVSQKQLAELMGVSLMTIKRMRDDGRIPKEMVLNIGTTSNPSIRLRKDEIEKWISGKDLVPETVTEEVTND